jgi:hypothetical protein
MSDADYKERFDRGRAIEQAEQDEEDLEVENQRNVQLEEREFADTFAYDDTYHDDLLQDGLPYDHEHHLDGGMGVQFEMEVPVDFGDSDSIDPEGRVEGDPTIGGRPPGPAEQHDTGAKTSSEEIQRTRFWDVTVPIRETSVLSPRLALTRNETNRYDEVYAGGDSLDNDTTTMGRPDIVEKRNARPLEAGDTSTVCRKRKGEGQEAERNKCQIDETPTPRSLYDEVEESRGLKLSKLGVGMIDMSPIQAHEPNVPGELFDHAQDKVETEPQVLNSRSAISPLGEEHLATEVEEIEVDFADRVFRSSLSGEALGDSSPRPIPTARNGPSTIDRDDTDPYGFRQAERCIRGEISVNRK